ncbi:hypothetical protein EH165_08965 [Nakamurella antarctica]|uniref:Uncharacterized protein n=1 Tax=Nakamurella antarctica TaxID=1902245 RepID=A0A3G8ZN66_9ACTN|nr:hypothetical protein [Nakamurella antarctica]AZI58247.1 hypothetical protein EH165_08965 [Nakamurella antarctica]
MTMGRNLRPGRGRGRRATPSISPAQILTAVTVLAVFIAAVAIGGVLGSVVVMALAAAAGALLVLRWNQIPAPLRLMRLSAVVAAVLVACSLFSRA